MKKSVSIATLGCKTNQYESAAMEERLRAAGYRVVPFDQGAQLVIVNTCTVTANTDAQSRNLVRRARRMNAGAKVVVTGCYAQVDPEALQSLPGVSVVLGNDEKKDFLKALEREGPEEGAEGERAAQVHVSDIRQATEAVPLTLSSFSEKSRAFLQIQNGCDAFCSYCIIPYARGGSRSVPPDEVLAQVRKLASAGYPEVVLTGIHIGGYGSDLAVRSSLLELVGRIEQETDLSRLRLGSIEPTEIPDALIEAVADSTIVCPHFHIPLQAGDDAVLARMNRNYGRNFFRELVLRIHRRVPEAAVGLDVIVGFPGETDAEFENTYRLIEELPVSHLHVFPYSRRPGTPAASMPGQVPGDVAKERAASLRTLGQEKLHGFGRSFIGRILEVVVEAGGEGNRRRGLSRNYLSIAFDGPTSLVGKAVSVRLTGAGDSGFSGELVEARES